MSEGLIFKRGGSGGSAKGVCAIKASWPEGYTCICYSGSKKLKAGKDTTEWIFLLPFVGTWTVEATNGTNTLSEAVELTTAGQGAIVELVPRQYLFKSGVGKIIPLSTSKESNSSITVGTDSIITSYTASDYSVTQVRTTSKIDVTKYTKLGAKIAATAIGSGDYVFSLVLSDKTVSNSSGTINSFDAYQKISKSTTPAEYYLDISAFTGEQYVGLFGMSKATIYDIWLE